MAPWFSLDEVGSLWIRMMSEFMSKFEWLSFWDGGFLCGSFTLPEGKTNKNNTNYLHLTSLYCRILDCLVRILLCGPTSKLYVSRLNLR